MLALILWLLIAVEFGAYAALGGALDRQGLDLAAFAVCAALAVRAGLVAVTFVLARRWRGEPVDAAVRAGGSLGAAAAEFAAVVALYWLLQPAEPAWRRLRLPGTSRAGPTVVFVHGLFCNAAFWLPTRRALARLGLRNTHALNLEPPLASIDEYVRQLGARLDALGAAPVILVGHSMGGLVARRLARHAEAGRIALIVTLGTPHHGSRFAALLGGANLRQMRPGSAWLAALNADEDGPPGVPLVSVHSADDNLVAPQASACVRNAQNVALAGVGHLGMAFSARCHRLIADAIAGFGRGRTPG